jgi:hypothetical protein
VVVDVVVDTDVVEVNVDVVDVDVDVVVDGLGFNENFFDEFVRIYLFP